MSEKRERLKRQAAARAEAERKAGQKKVDEEVEEWRGEAIRDANRETTK